MVGPTNLSSNYTQQVEQVNNQHQTGSGDIIEIQNPQMKI